MCISSLEVLYDLVMCGIAQEHDFTIICEVNMSKTKLFSRTATFREASRASLG